MTDTCTFLLGPDGAQHRCGREAVVVFRSRNSRVEYPRCAQHDTNGVVTEQLGLERTGIVPSASKPW